MVWCSSRLGLGRLGWVNFSSLSDNFTAAAAFCVTRDPAFHQPNSFHILNLNLFLPFFPSASDLQVQLAASLQALSGSGEVILSSSSPSSSSGCVTRKDAAFIRGLGAGGIERSRLYAIKLSLEN